MDEKQTDLYLIEWNDVYPSLQQLSRLARRHTLFTTDPEQAKAYLTSPQVQLVKVWKLAATDMKIEDFVKRDAPGPDTEG